MSSSFQSSKGSKLFRPSYLFFLIFACGGEGGTEERGQAERTAFRFSLKGQEECGRNARGRHSAFVLDVAGEMFSRRGHPLFPLRFREKALSRSGITIRLSLCIKSVLQRCSAIIHLESPKQSRGRNRRVSSNCALLLRVLANRNHVAEMLARLCLR